MTCCRVKLVCIRMPVCMSHVTSRKCKHVNTPRARSMAIESRIPVTTDQFVFEHSNQAGSIEKCVLGMQLGPGIAWFRDESRPTSWEPCSLQPNPKRTKRCHSLLKLGNHRQCCQRFIACVFQLLRHVLQTITGNMVNGQCADSDKGPLPDCCCNLDSTLGAFGAEQVIKDTCQIAVAIWNQPRVALVFRKEV